MPSGAPAAAPPAAAGAPRAPSAQTAWWEGIVTGRSTSASAWILALLPIISAAAQLGALYVYAFSPDYRAAASGALLLLGILPILLAIADRRALLRNNWPRPASAWWILLGSLVYLLARQLRLRAMSGRARALSAAAILAPLVATAGVVALVMLAEQLVTSTLLALPTGI